MSWDIIFQPEHLAMYGHGLIVTLSLLFSSISRWVLKRLNARYSLGTEKVQL